MMEIFFSIVIGILAILVWALILALIILPLTFWIWMLVDCVKRKFEKENDKVMWVLVIALLGLIGSIVYYFMVKRKDKKKKVKHSPK